MIDILHARSLFVVYMAKLRTTTLNGVSRTSFGHPAIHFINNAVVPTRDFGNLND